jgi:hypothetical protein
VHPEFEYVIADGSEPGIWSGLAGMAESYGNWLGVWEDFRVEAEAYLELAGERVLVLGYYSGRARTSPGELGQMRAKAAMLFHVRAGKVTRLVGYWDREHAFADLGLTPQNEDL